MSRRGLLRGLAGALAGGAAWASTARKTSAEEGQSALGDRQIEQSVCRWCFQSIPLDALARHATEIGLKSIELVPQEDWPILQQHGLACALTPSHSLFLGLNRKANHSLCIDQIRGAIDATARAGFPNVVTLAGFREDLPDEVSMENTVLGLSQVVRHAEQQKVNLCLEVINSRVDVEMKGRPGYVCDTVEWAVEVCKRISSERMKILFDVYHVQIMQGDLITRIREFQDYIGHYHTGGVPGRNEIDQTQEINYSAVVRAIAETGYRGFIGHEFIPKRDPIQSLREAFRICEV